MPNKHELICTLGKNLSEDLVLFSDMKLLFEKARTGGKVVLHHYVYMANQVGFPDDLRRAKSLAEDMFQIYKVARRFLARKQLAMAAGETEFRIGMRVLLDMGDRWISGNVTSLHPDGRFTFQAYQERSRVADPLLKVTVEVKL